ncbi:8205_t:CDS:2 [Diversispora eburnea]|uniref:8205_t:CDS:1 n=1 Tax=Diversispora eburnea TaxID=1213867 RepID=A0A9N8UYA2_9GLOM|nr:8205_t:CDS:2 [Diversispora eburnea]
MNQLSYVLVTKELIDFIEKHKYCINNQIKISDDKRYRLRLYLERLSRLPEPSKLGEPEEWFKQQNDLQSNKILPYVATQCDRIFYGYIDQVKAFEWFKKAAENDYADGQFCLGKCFYEGLGTKKDILNAIYWFNKAKENGNKYANELLEKIVSNM